MSLSQLIYSSLAVPGIGMREVEAIIATARRNNQDLDLTGMLLFDGREFLQVLEGPRQAVADMCERIRPDARHTNMQCQIHESILYRTFSNWSMAFGSLEDGGLQHFGGTMAIGAARQMAAAMASGKTHVHQFFSGYLRALTT